MARDQVGALEVITVWLGTDHGPDGDDRWPRIFGTFVWDSQTRGIVGGREVLTATEDEALLNHHRLAAAEGAEVTS